MAGAKRSKELAEIIGEHVRIHLKGSGPMIDMAEVGAVVHGLQGYVIDVTENYMYVGNSIDEGYNVVLDIDNINIIEIVEDVPEELLAVRDPDEEIH